MGLLRQQMGERWGGTGGAGGICAAVPSACSRAPAAAGPLWLPDPARRGGRAGSEVWVGIGGVCGAAELSGGGSTGRAHPWGQRGAGDRGPRGISGGTGPAPRAAPLPSPRLEPGALGCTGSIGVCWKLWGALGALDRAGVHWGCWGVLGGLGCTGNTGVHWGHWGVLGGLGSTGSTGTTGVYWDPWSTGVHWAPPGAQVYWDHWEHWGVLGALGCHLPGPAHPAAAARAEPLAVPEPPQGPWRQWAARLCAVPGERGTAAAVSVPLSPNPLTGRCQAPCSPAAFPRGARASWGDVSPNGLPKTHISGCWKGCAVLCCGVGPSPPGCARLLPPTGTAGRQRPCPRVLSPCPVPVSWFQLGKSSLSS